jgi:hypothetical protein
MTIKQVTLFALRWCGSCALLLFCWCGWLALALLLAVQVWVATRRELTLPDFALRAVERRLAASHVTARFGRAVFDPTGRCVIENVELYAPAHATPLVTMRAVYARVDFWALLVGDLRLHEVRVTGVDLREPAMLSPSGADEAVVSDLDGVFLLHGSDYVIAPCTFRVAGVTVTGEGGFHLPKTIRARPGSMPMLDLVLLRYLQAGRRLIALRSRLDGLEEPHLHLALTPSEDHGARVEAELFVSAFRPAAPYGVTGASARTTFPVFGDTPVPVTVTIQAENATWADHARLERLRVDLAGTLAPDRFAFVPLEVRATAAQGETMGVPWRVPVATAELGTLPRLSGAFSLEVAGAALTARGNIDLKQGAGRIDLAGSIAPSLVSMVVSRLPRRAARAAELAEPATVEGRVELAPGWHLLQAEADVIARHLTLSTVPLDAVSGHVAYAGTNLAATDVVLRVGDDVARGSYTMDTVTRDYRILIQGRLRPSDIAGWFHDWWPHFWGHFDFAAAPLVADVDVRSRWGGPNLVTVFCQADADHPIVRGMPFDRLRTELFIRPYFYDVFRFRGQRAGHSAQGSFRMTVDHERSVLRTLDLEAVSDLDLAECARMYGPVAVHLAAPYQFAEPPSAQFTAHFEGPTFPGGPHQRVTGTVSSHGRFALDWFPLNDIKFDGEYQDGNLDLPKIEAGFAGGIVVGQARLKGPPGAKRLSFDATVTGADLARAVDAVEEFNAAGRPLAPDRPRSRFLSGAPSSRLDGKVSAEGDWPHPLTYYGQGSASITGRRLGEIHLLGQLSELIGGTLRNATSLRLDAANADFKLEGNKLVFSQIRLTGPSAAIDGWGDYMLDAKTLDFTAKVFPLEQSKFVLAEPLSALLALTLSNMMEVRLTGPLEKPSWAFLYGPTNILRVLVGTSAEGAAPGTTSPAPDPSRPNPAPAASPP